VADEPRTRAQRKTDTMAKLRAKPADAWIATSDGDGPHLLPLNEIPDRTLMRDGAWLL
jgi:hypothetical protein